MKDEFRLRWWINEKIKTSTKKDNVRLPGRWHMASRQQTVNSSLPWGVNYLTCVNTRFSELRLSRLRTKRMDWKSSWMLALNCSSSIPQVALEYRIRDWTMNLNKYSRAWRHADGDMQSVKVHVILYNKINMKRWDGFVVETPYTQEMLHNIPGNHKGNPETM